jgi:hypothetical protein
MIDFWLEYTPKNKMKVSLLQKKSFTTCCWEKENISLKHSGIEKTKVCVKIKDESVNETLVTPKTTIIQRISMPGYATPILYAGGIVPKMA